MIILGLTQRVLADPLHGERRDALDQRWTSFLNALGMAGIALPNSAESAISLADQVGVAGIVLTGGDDLVEYGGLAPERDATELALLSWAQAKKKPLLGICRGMQAIQHSHGVRLQYGEGHVGQIHEIEIDSHIRRVNSYHNWMARNSTPELLVWAQTTDGVVEAVRHRSARQAGIMWHPERNIPFDPLDLDFFRTFFGPNQ